MTLTLYRPALDELSYRAALIGDESTMSYNAKWGGSIPFPRERWAAWYEKWLLAPETLRFYRYLYDADSRLFVGEAAYYFDEAQGVHLVSIIVEAQHRRKGYGALALRLLCGEAKKRGIEVLADDIALDNPSFSLFLREGFREQRRNEICVFVEKKL